VSNLGAFLDSVFDKLGEITVYLGITAGLQAVGVADGTLLAAAAMGSALMVSYTRSKSEGLGFTQGTGMAAIGLMPREVRLVLLSAGLIIAGIVGTAFESSGEGAGGAAIPPGIGVLFLTLGIILIGSTITTIQRILHVRAQAKRQAASIPSQTPSAR
jgi:phosphatidylglycerophosphate synthase